MVHNEYFTADLPGATAGQDEDSTLSPGGKYVYMHDLHTLDKRVPQLRGALPESACKVLTPLKVASWADALKDYPDQELAEYLLRGIVQGFHIGFDYSRYCSLTGFEERAWDRGYTHVHDSAWDQVSM